MKEKITIQEIAGVLCGLFLGIVFCLICLKTNSLVILPIAGFVIGSLGYYGAVTFQRNYSGFIWTLLLFGGTVCILSIFLNIFFPQNNFYENQNISNEVCQLESPYSQEQFDQISQGMTYDEVVGLLGTEGTMESEYNYPEYKSEIYYWGDFASGYIDVTLIDGYVQHKYQYHLQ